MKLHACLLAILVLTSPAIAQTWPQLTQGQPASEIERREADLITAWEKSPLVIRTATFVTEKAPLYGAQSPRPSSSFKRGEPILAYLEPIGYGWRREGELYNLGITLDVVLKTRDGKILGGQEKFLNSEQRSRHRMRELMLNVTLTLGSTPPGDYVVEFVAKDLAGKTGTVSMPFTITE